MTHSKPSASLGGEILLDYSESASRLNVSKRTFAAWVAAGRIPTVRLPGRVRRIRPADLEAFVASGLSDGRR